MHELASCGHKGIFYTLTYSPEFYPADNSLHVSDLQKFIKRVRRKIEPLRIKHFSCGEYGDSSNAVVSGANYGRAHYHGILLGLELCNANIEIIRDEWPFGFVSCGSVTPDSCRYVTDYVLKKYNGQKKEEVYGNAQPPFKLSSNGLGKRYVLENLAQFLHNLGYYKNGQKKILPRYYKNLIFDYFALDKHDLKAAYDFKVRYSLDFIYGENEKSKELLYKLELQLQNSGLNPREYIYQCGVESQRHADYKLKSFTKGGI